MRSGRLVGWRRETLCLAGRVGGPGRASRRWGLVRYQHAGIDTPQEITAGPDGALWFTNYASNSIGRITTAVTPKISGFAPASGAAGTMVIMFSGQMGRSARIRP